jgi:hypothetical protein
MKRFGRLAVHRVVWDAKKMPTNRTPLYRHPRHRLSFFEELSLEYGEAAHRPTFASDTERQAAWARHRNHLMRRWRHGWRSQAWWDYEAPIPLPRDQEYEKAALWEANLLSDAERAELEACWREEFERAQEPAFQHCIGHKKQGDTFATWLSGVAAKRAHYKWAGIPRELIRRWTAERWCRNKAICKRTARISSKQPRRTSSRSY